MEKGGIGDMVINRLQLTETEEAEIRDHADSFTELSTKYRQIIAKMQRERRAANTAWRSAYRRVLLELNAAAEIPDFIGPGGSFQVGIDSRGLARWRPLLDPLQEGESDHENTED